MMEENEDLKKIVDFVRKILNVINLEIHATYQVNIEYQLIANVILMLHRNKVNLYHLFFIFLVIMIVIYFLKSWFMRKKMVHDQVNFDNIPKANEQNFSVTYGCIKFIDSFPFLSSKLVC